MTATLPTRKNQQFLSFSLPPDVQAILSTEHLTELVSLSLSQVVPIAHVPPQVLGVCNWRGEVLWLVNLAALLGTESLTPQVYQQPVIHVVIIHYQNAILGLVVDQINEVFQSEALEIRPAIAPHSPQMSAYVQGCWLTPQGKTLWILDCEALISCFCGSSP